VSCTNVLWSDLAQGNTLGGMGRRRLSALFCLPWQRHRFILRRAPLDWRLAQSGDNKHVLGAGIHNLMNCILRNLKRRVWPKIRIFAFDRSIICLSLFLNSPLEPLLYFSPGLSETKFRAVGYTLGDDSKPSSSDA
jgi:hypothetical protein